MKRLILAFALIIMYCSAMAQDLDKAAIRAQKKMERAERRRMRDSLEAEEIRQYWHEIHVQDSIRQEERKREGATAIRAISPISAPEALDKIARALIKFGYVLRVDKEYGTINTEPKWGNGASYTLHYVIEQHPKGCQAKGFAYAHGQVSTFHTGLGFGTNKAIDLRIEYGGAENSPSMIAFRELFKYLTALPDTEITYYRDDI